MLYYESIRFQIKIVLQFLVKASQTEFYENLLNSLGPETGKYGLQ
jgi:hypothetical protein